MYKDWILNLELKASLLKNLDVHCLVQYIVQQSHCF